MKIGELSTATGTTVESIRFYEREGLLAKPSRTEGNYRVYGDEHVQRLVFIRRCRSLDMSLAEIGALLRFKDAPGTNCQDVNSLLDEHIGHVASRVRELRVLERQLRDLRSQCQSIESGENCGILKELSSDALCAATLPRPRVSVHGQGDEVHGRSSRRK